MADHALSSRRSRDGDVLPVRRPWIDQREIDEVNAALAAGALGFGRRTVEFETRFARFVGARHAVAVNSCWAAFHLTFEALGLRPGDEILLSVATSAPAIAAMAQVGARPIPVDVDPVTLTLNVADAWTKLTARTRVVMPGHFAGCPAAMDEVLALAAQHDLLVVEDAVDALPASYQGRMIGSIGAVSVFGLRDDLSITCGEGSMVTTDHDEIAALFRARRFYGVPGGGPPPPWSRAGYETAVTHGFGYEMADVNAAVGLGQLSKVQMFHAIRSYYADLYAHGLSDLDPLHLPRAPVGTEHAWVYYVVRLRLERLKLTRDAFIARLRAQKVGAAVDFVPLYLHRYFGPHLGLQADDFPHAWMAHETSVSLPLYPSMTEADVWNVIRTVREVVGGDARR